MIELSASRRHFGNPRHTTACDLMHNNLYTQYIYIYTISTQYTHNIYTIHTQHPHKELATGCTCVHNGRRSICTVRLYFILSFSKDNISRLNARVLGYLVNKVRRLHEDLEIIPKVMRLKTGLTVSARCSCLLSFLYLSGLTDCRRLSSAISGFIANKIK